VNDGAESRRSYHQVAVSTSPMTAHGSSTRHARSPDSISPGTARSAGSAAGSAAFASRCGSAGQASDA
jgi:hypothetical protein